MSPALLSQYGEIYNFPSTAFEKALDEEELSEEEEVKVVTKSKSLLENDLLGSRTQILGDFTFHGIFDTL